jgi:tRNA A37 threonylcarbamoyladenosine modification protein TsaB
MPKSVNLPLPTLVINSREREKVELAIVTQGNVTTLARDERAQSVAALIPELLAKAGLKLDEIKTIAVCNKPGSLTGTRIGVTVANTLGWLNNLPIIGLSAATLTEAITELQSTKHPPQKTVTVQDEVVY